MIISRATPAALLMRTAGLGRAGCPLCGRPLGADPDPGMAGPSAEPGDAALPLPRRRQSWLLSALPGVASSWRGQLQEMEKPQRWRRPPLRPCPEQDPEPSSPRAAARPGEGCRASPLRVSSGGGWDGVPRGMTPKRWGIRGCCLRDLPERVAVGVGCWWPATACLALAASFVSAAPRLPLSLLLKPSGCAGPRRSPGRGPGPGCSAPRRAVSGCQPWRDTSFAAPPRRGVPRPGPGCGSAGAGGATPGPGPSPSHPAVGSAAPRGPAPAPPATHG